MECGIAIPSLNIIQHFDISDLTALNKLNEVCKQTCNEEEPHEVPESSKTKDPDSKIQDTIRKTEDPTSETQDPTVKTQDPTSKTQDPVSKTQDPTFSTIETTRRLHKLKLVPRGLYFNVVDFIEIATNKTDFVDDMFKRMDRDVSNLVKKVSVFCMDLMMANLNKRSYLVNRFDSKRK